MPAMQCLQLARAEQRRGATLIDGQTVAKAQKLWQDYLRQRMRGRAEYSAIVTIDEKCRNSELAGVTGFNGAALAHWQIEPQPVVAEQVLDALVEQW